MYANCMHMWTKRVHVCIYGMRVIRPPNGVCSRLPIATLHGVQEREFVVFTNTKLYFLFAHSCTLPHCMVFRKASSLCSRTAKSIFSKPTSPTALRPETSGLHICRRPVAWRRPQRERLVNRGLCECPPLVVSHINATERAIVRNCNMRCWKDSHPFDCRYNRNFRRHLGVKHNQNRSIFYNQFVSIKDNENSLVLNNGKRIRIQSYFW